MLTTSVSAKIDVVKTLSTSVLDQPIYVVLVLIVNMLTSNNNMRTRHVQFLELATVTPPFIQPDCEISNELNLSRVYCLLNQELCVALIELKNNVSVCLSMFIFDDLV